MRISVIIAAYNAEQFLAETIRSVQAQTLADWELIVVDDGSQDGTAALVREFAKRDCRIHVIVQQNTGGCGARNRGYLASDPSSEFVIFLDHDDLWKPETLQTLADALEAHPEAIAAHGIAEEIDAQGRLLYPDESPQETYQRYAIVGKRLVPWPAEKPTTFATLVPWCCIPTPGLVLVRRCALPPDELARAGERIRLDWDMWLYLSRRGHFHFVNEVLLEYRRHSASSSSNHKYLHQRIYGVRRRLWNEPDISAQHRRIVHEGYRAIELYFLRHKLKYVGKDLFTGQIKSAVKQGVSALGHLARFVRGRP